MRISSQVGRGTTVSLWLPVDEAEIQFTGALPEAAPVACDKYRVMVVDDDPLIAAIATAMLEDLGHTVIEVDSGSKALNLLNGGMKVDLVITDYAMPMMTGLELAAVIQQNWPWLAVILASGYADVRDLDDLRLPRLPKPYHQSELAACIVATVEQHKVVSLDQARRA